MKRIFQLIVALSIVIYFISFLSTTLTTKTVHTEKTETKKKSGINDEKQGYRS